MPTTIPNIEHSLLVALSLDLVLMSNRMRVERHLYENLRTQSYEFLHTCISLHLRPLRERVVDDVLAFELGSILVEPIGNKNGDVIHPCVTRCSREHDPVVHLCDLQKCFDPSSRSYQALFVEYEKGIRASDILTQIVPAVYDHATVERRVPCFPDYPLCGLVLPITRISFLRCRDYNQILRLITIHVLQLFFHVISHSHTSFTGSDWSPENRAVVQLRQGVSPMRTQI